MKSIVFAFILTFSSTIFAEQSDMQMKMAPPEKPVELLSGLGSLHHPTSTKNPEAQSFFDRGFRMIYGFNHEEAVRSFKRGTLTRNCREIKKHYDRIVIDEMSILN